jgi:hypothetical protein
VAHAAQLALLNGLGLIISMGWIFLWSCLDWLLMGDSSNDFGLDWIAPKNKWFGDGLEWLALVRKFKGLTLDSFSFISQ